MNVQRQHPNFVEGDRFFMVRCFVCDPEHGKENYLPAVASGQCAWCGAKVEIEDEEEVEE